MTYIAFGDNQGACLASTRK